MVLVTIAIPQLLLDKVVNAPFVQVVQVVDILVGTQRLILVTMEIPKLLVDKVIDVPVVV